MHLIWGSSHPNPLLSFQRIGGSLSTVDKYMSWFYFFRLLCDHVVLRVHVANVCWFLQTNYTQSAGISRVGPAIYHAIPPHLSLVPVTHPSTNHMQTSTNAPYHHADKENHRGQSDRSTPLITTDLCSKKKDSGGWIRWPSEKVRQAMHEREEMAQHRDAKVHKDQERHRHCHLMEEGSETLQSTPI